MIFVEICDPPSVLYLQTDDAKGFMYDPDTMEFVPVEGLPTQHFPEDEEGYICHFADPRDIPYDIYEGVDAALEKQFGIKVQRDPITYTPSDPVPEYYDRYCELGGKVIKSLDEYRYFYKLFYTLTQNRVGGDCPMPSDLGFDMFYKTLKAYAKEMSLPSTTRECNVFFDSIDSVHAYT